MICLLLRGLAVVMVINTSNGQKSAFNQFGLLKTLFLSQFWSPPTPGKTYQLLNPLCSLANLAFLLTGTETTDMYQSARPIVHPPGGQNKAFVHCPLLTLLRISVPDTGLISVCSLFTAVSKAHV